MAFVNESSEDINATNINQTEKNFDQLAINFTTSFAPEINDTSCQDGNGTECSEIQPQVMDSFVLPQTILLVLVGSALIMLFLLFVLWLRRRKRNPMQEPKILILFFPDNTQHERAVMAYANYLQEHCHFDVMRYVIHYHQEDPDRRLAKTMLSSKFIFIMWSQKAADIINAVFSKETDERPQIQGITQPIDVLKERISKETKSDAEPEDCGIFNIYYIQFFETLIPEALQQLPKFKLLRDADRILNICNQAFLASYQKMKPIFSKTIFSTVPYRVSNHEEQTFPGKGIQEKPEGKEVRRAIKAARRKYGSECRKERLRNKNLTVPTQALIAISDMDSDMGDSEFEEEDPYNYAHRLLPSMEDGSTGQPLYSWTAKQDGTYPMREINKFPGMESAPDADNQRTFSPQP